MPRYGVIKGQKELGHAQIGPFKEFLVLKRTGILLTLLRLSWKT